MSAKTRYMMLIVEYKEEDEKAIQNLVDGIEKPISTKHGQIKRAYRGSDKRIISSLESILKLT